MTERLVSLTIDGQPVEVPEGTTLLEACASRGIDTPTLCYLENLTPVNVCRVCVVEVTGARVLVPACSRRVEPGMEIQTDSERVRLSRRMVLEFLASSVDLSTAPAARTYVERYGADPSRLMILFLGPADQDMEWTEEAVEGMSRFVRRLWRVVAEVAESAPAGDPEGGPLARKAHETIAKVTDDVGRRFAFNTGISAVMELVNELSRDAAGRDSWFAAETAVSLIQPYAPHVAEELWERLGRERLWEQPWPVADPALLERETIEVVLQVNGKLRDRLQVPAGIAEDELVALARGSERVRAHLDGGEPRKTIVVPGKLVNFVV
jgi:ferredoxin